MSGIDGGVQSRWTGHVAGAEAIAHGWVLEDGCLRLLAEISVDVDAMPQHLPYGYFGVRREEMGPGPVRLSLALAAGPDGRMGVARAWRSGAQPAPDAAEQAVLMASARPGAMTGQSVAAPFTVPVAVLVLAGILKGSIAFVTGTRELVEAAHGTGTSEIYDGYAAEARDALASVIGTEALARLDRIAAMDWQPTEHKVHALVTTVRPGVADASLMAAEVWPFLRPRIPAVAEEMAESEGNPEPIDVAVLALGSGGSRAHLRRLAPVGERLDINAINLLTRLPVDWLPRSGDDPAWSPLIDISRACTQMVFVTGLEPAELLRDSKGRWGPYVDRITSVALPEAGDATMAAVMAHASDMAMAFERRLLSPALAHVAPNEAIRNRTPYKEALRLLVGTGALGQFAERIGRYDGRREAMAARLRATSPHVLADLSWDAHLPTWRDPATGLSIVPLTDEAQLRAEGRHGEGPADGKGLSHCVGDYGLPCAKGQSRILSVRRETGALFERVSTAEICWSEDGGRAVSHVRQHASRGNGQPSAAAVAALASYMATGCVGAPPTPAHIPSMPPGARQAGYDTGIRANVEMALALWRPMLPRALRASDLESFVRAIGSQATRPQAASRIPTARPTAAQERLSV